MDVNASIRLLFPGLPGRFGSERAEEMENECCSGCSSFGVGTLLLMVTAVCMLGTNRCCFLNFIHELSHCFNLLENCRFNAGQLEIYPR